MVILFFRYVVGLISLTAEQITAADVTGNGTVSTLDASWIARKAVDDTIVFLTEQWDGNKVKDEKAKEVQKL